jgi:hypothetical protein
VACGTEPKLQQPGACMHVLAANVCLQATHMAAQPESQLWCTKVLLHEWCNHDPDPLQVHFSCDDRAKAGELGTFREYATGETARTYVCPECDKAKRQRTG